MHKKKCLFLVAIFIFLNSINAQFTETFESYTTGCATSFTSNSVIFNGTLLRVFVPGQCLNVNLPGLGVGNSCTGDGCGTTSDKFFDNGGNYAIGQTYKIATSGAVGTAFALKSMYVYISTNSGTSPTSGSVTFVGKKSGSIVFSFTKNSWPNSTNGFSFVNFATEGGANNSFSVIDAIEMTTAGTINYIAVDNFTWAPATMWNGSSWNNGNPSSTIDAVIGSSTVPTSSFTCKALTINSTFALTTTGITATVNGNIVNNGNGIAGTGGLTIAANSTISGSNINFNGTLTVNSGAVLTTGGLLTLTSNATNTARVAAGATAGGYISGNVTVQKFIAGGAGRRKFRFLGHPFTTMNLTELSNDIDITGAISGSNANLFSATTTSNPSAFTFTESAGNAATGTTNNTGWTALTSASSITIINGGQGIRALVRGPKGQTGVLLANPPNPNDVTLSLTGALRQGDFTQNLSFTDAARGWNLISNPYASNIDWNLIRTSNLTNVNDAIYTYRPALSGGNYGTYVNGSTANGGSQFVEAYSSFLVRANAASPTIAWQEADKVSNNPTNTVFRTAQTINNRISLTLKNTTTQDTDEVVLRFGDDPATDLFDGKYDAENLAGASQDLHVLDQNQQAYSIYHGSALKEATTEKRAVQLGINNLVTGNYSLEATTLNAFVGNHIAYLKDNETDELTEIKDNTQYSFTVSSTQNNYNRFSIVFNAKKPLPAVSTTSSFTISLSPNPANSKTVVSYTQATAENTTIIITDATGKKVQTINLGKVQNGVQPLNIAKLAVGTYYVQVNNGKESKTEKLVIQ